MLNDRSGHASVIKSSDKTVTTLVNGIDPMWHDGVGAPYLGDFAGVASTATAETPVKDVAAAALKAAGEVQIEGLLSFVPPLPSNNLAVVEVSLKDVAKSSETYKRLWPGTAPWSGLDFHAKGAILSNTWIANSSVGTRSMVAKAVPTAQGVGALVQAAALGLSVWDPMQAPRFEVGKIAVDEVPSDRLK